MCFVYPVLQLVLVSETIVFGADLCFAGIYFFHCEIFEPHQLIAAKLCTMIGSVFDLIILVQNIGGPLQKNFTGQKHAKFGAILYDFKRWRRMSSEGMKIFKIGQLHDLSRFLPRSLKKKFSKLWPNNYGYLYVESYPPISIFWKTMF